MRVCLLIPIYASAIRPIFLAGTHNYPNVEIWWVILWFTQYWSIYHYIMLHTNIVDKILDNWRYSLNEFLLFFMSWHCHFAFQLLELSLTVSYSMNLWVHFTIYTLFVRIHWTTIRSFITCYPLSCCACSQGLINHEFISLPKKQNVYSIRFASHFDARCNRFLSLE